MLQLQAALAAYVIINRHARLPFLCNMMENKSFAYFFTYKRLVSVVSACCMPYAADAIVGVDGLSQTYFIIIQMLLWRDKTCPAYTWLITSRKAVYYIYNDNIMTV